MNSSYSSYRHGAIHPILYFVLVQTAATSFTFSSVFILLLCAKPIQSKFSHSNYKKTYSGLTSTASGRLSALGEGRAGRRRLDRRLSREGRVTAAAAVTALAAVVTTAVSASSDRSSGLASSKIKA